MCDEKRSRREFGNSLGGWIAMVLLPVTGGGGGDSSWDHTYIETEDQYTCGH